MPPAAPLRRRRVGVLGCGALGEHLLRSVAADPLGRFEVAFAWNRGAARLDALAAEGLVPAAARCGAAAALAELLAFGADVVVEVSHPDVSARLGAGLLGAGVDFVCGSPPALADGALLAAMLAASARGGGALYVPSGALWGAQDIAKLSARGSLAFLEVTMKKHPASLRLAPGPLADALGAFLASDASRAPGAECVLYEGPVRALCPLAPNNVNTMAAAAVAAHATLGFDGTRCRLVAAPGLEAHVITVDARGRAAVAAAPAASAAAAAAEGADKGEKDAAAAAAAAAPRPPFRAFTERYSPAAPGAVSSTATFDSFFSSLVEARGRGPGIHMV